MPYAEALAFLVAVALKVATTWEAWWIVVRIAKLVETWQNSRV